MPGAVEAALQVRQFRGRMMPQKHDVRKSLRFSRKRLFGLVCAFFIMLFVPNVEALTDPIRLNQTFFNAPILPIPCQHDRSNNKFLETDLFDPIFQGQEAILDNLIHHNRRPPNIPITKDLRQATLAATPVPSVYHVGNEIPKCHTDRAYEISKSYQRLVRTIGISKWYFFDESHLPELLPFFERIGHFLEKYEPGTHAVFLAKVEILGYSGIRLTPDSSGEEVTVKVLEVVKGDLPKSTYVVRTDAGNLTKADVPPDYFVNKVLYIIGEYHEGNIRLFMFGTQSEVRAGPWVRQGTETINR
ncbi:hypothetical protein ACTRXD_01995 [Nitrospira sp. T9]|uniref:hypothetical protein n=1 Tax=unclassified Nitrospira TaxID=2652172 RepID=UPI003F9A7F1C